MSGGGVEPPHAKLATFRKMRLPVALELLELLATVKIPQPDRPVFRHTDEKLRIRGSYKTIRLWDVESGKELKKLEGHR